MSAAVIIGTERRPLAMRFAAGAVKHFGLHMYSTAVPAIAETVANAWDADAPDVWIDIPLGEPITQSSVITIRDNGTGMMYDDCNDNYLVVGRDRREMEKRDRSLKGRPVMGHKGLGKFAPFGIADIVKVSTTKGGKRTVFEMDYRKMVPPKGSAKDEFVKEYLPVVIEVEALTEDRDGTLLELTNLRLKRAISEDIFRQAMARRFTCIGQGFNVHVNGVTLAPFGVSFDLRIPDSGLNAEQVGDDAIRWWVGFTPTPLTMDELRGVSVVVRGKLAQNPFFFQLSKGITGQAGMQYMTGVVEADFLDEEEDLISTDRASVLWEHPRAKPLLDWGQAKVREWLGAWLERRAATRLARMQSERPALKEIMDSLSHYPARERDQLQGIVKRLATTVEDDEQLEWMVSSIEGAYQDRRFMELVKRLDEVGDAALADVMSIFREYEVLESIRLAQVAAARIQVIHTFKKLVETKAKEKPDLQDFVKKNPWLLDPAWQVLRHEVSIDTVVAQELALTPEKDEEGRLRLDFFCLADSLRVVVVEVKRPGRQATVEEWQRFQRYVAALQAHYERLTNPADRRIVEGLFVATELDPTGRQLAKEADGRIYRFTDWAALLRRAENMHRDYLEALAAKAPAGDPRLVSIRRVMKLADGGAEPERP